MSSVSAAVRLLGPRIPMMLNTAFWHSLSLTPTSAKWDLKTELIIKVIRSIMEGSTSSITKQQNFSLRDPGVKGKMWVSRVTLPNPEEDDVWKILERAIEEMADVPISQYERPELVSVEAEWHGYRADASNYATEPSISEQEKYANMMKEVESDLTILYMHGGAYYLMDPASHRQYTSKLAKLTKGRALSVRYRLAPQHPFPAAILDCLLAYISLLYPPPGSIHAAVASEHIVFAGDSAGGNMCLALLQLLLHLQRTSATIRFHGNDIRIPLPAGVATNSAWCDITRSMPSLYTNACYDYLPPPNSSTSSETPGSAETQHPTQPLNKHPCPLWPATPPRCDLYASGPLLCHPLVSPLAATPESWRGAPPLFFCVGEEMLADEVRVMAKRCASVDVKVRWEGFEAMPHCFAQLLPDLPTAEVCYAGWAGFMRKVVEGKDVPVGGKWVEAKTGKESEVDLMALTQLEDEEVWRRMRDERDRRQKAWEEAWVRSGSSGEKEVARL